MALGGTRTPTQVDRTLQLIRSTGCKSGLVFNPATPLDCLEYADDGRAPGFSESENLPLVRYVMDKVDIILLMSVNPGFGGQSFIPGTLDKARKARKMIDDSGFDIRLQIDGGVSGANIKEVAEVRARSAAFAPPRAPFFVPSRARARNAFATRRRASTCSSRARPSSAIRAPRRRTR